MGKGTDIDMDKDMYIDVDMGMRKMNCVNE
jgi:hypothetical protein